jgi:hypothetical protein
VDQTEVVIIEEKINKEIGKFLEKQNGISKRSWNFHLEP